MASICSWSRWH